MTDSRVIEWFDEQFGTTMMHDPNQQTYPRQALQGMSDTSVECSRAIGPNA